MTAREALAAVAADAVEVAGCRGALVLAANGTTLATAGVLTGERHETGALVAYVDAAPDPATAALLAMIAARITPILRAGELEAAEHRAHLARRHITRHLELLAQAGQTLGQAVSEEGPALEDLARTVAAHFADWCRIDLVRNARLEPIAVHGGPVPPQIDATIAEVAATGEPHLSWDAEQSRVVVPIRLHGLVLGALACGTGSGRRGYRASDVEALEELAARTAATLERISLYIQTQRAAAAANARAAQLRRLSAAALAIEPQRTIAGVADVLASEAALITGGRPTSVGLDGRPPPAWAQRTLALVGSGPLDESSWLAIGGDTPLGPDEESIVTALAQLGAAAIDRTRLYETVRSSQARLLAMIDAAPVCILELARDGTVVRANPAATTAFGTTIHPASLRRLRRLSEDAIARAGRHNTGATTNVECALTGASGDEIPVALSATVLADGVMVMARDLTVSKQLEAQLARAQRIEAVGQVAGGVAHDFNNLLTVILGHAALLRAQVSDDRDLAGDAEAISLAAERAAAVTSQLLTISRGDLVPTELFDPRARLQRLTDTLRSVLPESVELVLDVEPGTGLVRMSPGQFDQVLLNLAVNARDAMELGGTFTVRLRESGAVTITVSDTGSGMNEANAARCFEPFFSTKGGERGTGLGLATVHSVVSGAGGSITLTTAEGLGTSFGVTLPLAFGAVPVEGNDAGDAVVSRGSEHILLVEDEAGLRRLAVEVLRGAGYIVTPAVDGRAALEWLQNAGAHEWPDLLLTDVVMPRVGGADLARAVLEILPGLPVLFMTGYVDEDSRNDLAGGEVLHKPFVITELVERVRRTLDRVPVGQGSKR